MRILLIEDEHKIANSIKKGLEQESYAVDLVYDGDQGFDLAGCLQKMSNFNVLARPRFAGPRYCSGVRFARASAIF